MHLFKDLSNTKKRAYILLVLLFIGISIRIIGISTIPAGLNQDEASIGYDAFSIMTSGLDRNADSYPVHLKAWGSGQNALYAYLSMPFISLFGLNTFSVRIVNAIASCLSLLLFYSIFKLVFDRKKSFDGIGTAGYLSLEHNVCSMGFGIKFISICFPFWCLFSTFRDKQISKILSNFIFNICD
jgi:4-amino-4-deoxy-L-arabinose transferase-like glycosyltransferase